MILTEYGYTVLTARDSGEALALARHHESPIDLLVTDVVMPGMNGRELRDELSALFPHMKTLFMSGYTPDVIATRGVIDEGIEFLPKPFSVVSLTAKVHEMLCPRASRSGSPSTAENPTCE
jgi:two-component system, cell cycle sensor histidine kinase and response regulator CckA